MEAALKIRNKKTKKRKTGLPPGKGLTTAPAGGISNGGGSAPGASGAGAVGGSGGAGASGGGGGGAA